ncbi:hypothetical protein [Curtobacterium sp. ISL-83]|uniref:hypothetical protein n=1 Tax=Curtobacterium sp. ISL-83 TaxID=2819145 RepID=UPI001BE65FFE|nr:hypothetical protein [Curtobacterium sp. ISL-83]MBT2501068.1 hypothetical protein [Curtobacterium sp. ISL-83]
MIRKEDDLLVNGERRRTGDEVMAAAVALLRKGGIALHPGLSDAEVNEIELRFDFRFNPDHRQFLQLAVPIAPGWADWRDEDEIRKSLHAPIEGVLFDVQNGAFWPASWGDRPVDLGRALATAEVRLTSVPQLIPVRGHRYMVAGDHNVGTPVFSVHQTDDIVYGDNFLDYVSRELFGGELSRSCATKVPFWSQLADGLESSEM